ncbi:hypothetical protein UFOVP73_4 [uncultured Caudovirales phage]|uniref:Uncharacterized protein n=1 Tax=uncultured Caudovirales phage TaxID=2100421 RepID=A0A6J7WB80_9CAUD|nr:hypothetical protein UFOVP73_4 [uncultured Caudovirales phage]CAB5194829.1 hypothetical protein UFOVP170_26 [uncultured Caudovirales phage]
MEGLAPEDFRRLESKVDKLTDAVTRLILVEERQTTQGERIGKVEVTLAAHDVAIAGNRQQIDQWVQRGIGAWAVAAVLFAIVKFVGGVK